MRRWDFVAAYLQGNLEEGEVIYCSLPPGYTTIANSKGEQIPNLGKDGKPRVYRVKKTIYGAAQSGRWNTHHYTNIQADNETDWSPICG